MTVLLLAYAAYLVHGAQAVAELLPRTSDVVPTGGSEVMTGNSSWVAKRPRRRRPRVRSAARVASKILKSILGDFDAATPARTTRMQRDGVKCCFKDGGAKDWALISPNRFGGKSFCTLTGGEKFFLPTADDCERGVLVSNIGDKEFVEQVKGKNFVETGLETALQAMALAGITKALSLTSCEDYSNEMKDKLMPCFKKGNKDPEKCDVICAGSIHDDKMTRLDLMKRIGDFPTDDGVVKGFEDAIVSSPEVRKVAVSKMQSSSEYPVDAILDAAFNLMITTCNADGKCPDDRRNNIIKRAVTIEARVKAEMPNVNVPPGMIVDLLSKVENQELYALPIRAEDLKVPVPSLEGNACKWEHSPALRIGNRILKDIIKDEAMALEKIRKALSQTLSEDYRDSMRKRLERFFRNTSGCTVSRVRSIHGCSDCTLKSQGNVVGRPTDQENNMTRLDLMKRIGDFPLQNGVVEGFEDAIVSSPDVRKVAVSKLQLSSESTVALDSILDTAFGLMITTCNADEKCRGARRKEIEVRVDKINDERAKAKIPNVFVPPNMIEELSEVKDRKAYWEWYALPIRAEDLEGEWTKEDDCNPKSKYLGPALRIGNHILNGKIVREVMALAPAKIKKALSQTFREDYSDDMTKQLKGLFESTDGCVVDPVRSISDGCTGCTFESNDKGEWVLKLPTDKKNTITRLDLMKSIGDFPTDNDVVRGFEDAIVSSPDVRKAAMSPESTTDAILDAAFNLMITTCNADKKCQEGRQFYFSRRFKMFAEGKGKGYPLPVRERIEGLLSNVESQDWYQKWYAMPIRTEDLEGSCEEKNVFELKSDYLGTALDIGNRILEAIMVTEAKRLKRELDEQNKLDDQHTRYREDEEEKEEAKKLRAVPNLTPAQIKAEETEEAERLKKLQHEKKIEEWEKLNKPFNPFPEWDPDDFKAYEPDDFEALFDEAA